MQAFLAAIAAKLVEKLIAILISAAALYMKNQSDKKKIKEAMGGDDAQKVADDLDNIFRG